MAALLSILTYRQNIPPPFPPFPLLLERTIGEPDEEETPLVALRWAHAHGVRLPEDACKLAIGASKLRTLQVR